MHGLSRMTTYSGEWDANLVFDVVINVLRNICVSWLSRLVGHPLYSTALSCQLCLLTQETGRLSLATNSVYVPTPHAD